MSESCELRADWASIEMVVNTVGTPLESTDDVINRRGQDSLHELLKNQ
jgi:hypothetical protein